MKRFWTEATVVDESDDWGVTLDGKPVRTPARKPLLVPTKALAGAITKEWNSAGETIDPRAMPLTGLANAAIDHVEPNRELFAADLASYGQADLACYRAESPPRLVEAQKQHWDPLLAWGRRKYDLDFETTSGVIHVPQPAATIRRLAHEVGALNAFRLAGLAPLVTIGGSLLAGLAVLEGAIDAESAWQAVAVDERWQLDQWGADAEAEAVLEARRRDYLAAADFLRLLDN